VKLIFWGLILVLFDINLYLGRTILSILPDFVGYILILKGMAGETAFPRWERARSLLTAAAVLTGAVWALNAVGVGAGEWAGLLLPLIPAVMKLLVTHRVCGGFRDLEKEHGWDLQGRSLSSAWMVVALWVVLEQLMGWVGLAPMVMIAMIAAVLFEIYFLFRFHKSRRAFEDYEACREED